MTARKRSKNGNSGTGMYMREGTTSRVMEGDRPYDEFYNFNNVSPEHFGYILVSDATPTRNLKFWGRTADNSVSIRTGHLRDTNTERLPSLVLAVT
jgi:hypothetical protein